MLLFLASGGLAALINLTSRFALTPVIGFQPSIVVAYLLGMGIAFVLFRSFVFGKSGTSIAHESGRFIIVNLVALVLVWTISTSLASIVFPAIGMTWHPQDVAHVIGTCVPALSSYFGHRYFTFQTAGSRQGFEPASGD